MFRMLYQKKMICIATFFLNCLFCISAVAKVPTDLQYGKLHLRFDFGNGEIESGYTQVNADEIFSYAKGYGFEQNKGEILEYDRGGYDALKRDFVTSDSLFRFSVAVPEGNYRVTMIFGDASGESITTVKAETRRLMLEQIFTPKGKFVTRTFYVNTRNSKLSPGNQIKLDVREWDPRTNLPVTSTWDDKLTLQFSDSRPCVCAIEIESVSDAITIFIIGDSTVADQASEPYGTWGQQLSRWFSPPVVIANHAESGQTLKAFRFQRRWDKVLELMKPGDYVFMQFGHNDLNRQGHDAMWPIEDEAGDWVNTYSDANTDYIWELAMNAVEIKRRGGIPVIVSPMTKMNKKTGLVNIEGMGDYPEASRKAAELAHCAFIDLNTMSIEIVKALGTSKSSEAYVDGLHSNTFGGYLFSRCIVEGIRKANLDIVRYITSDAGTFDSMHPKPLPDEFKMPIDPRVPLPSPPGYPTRISRQ